MITNRLRSTVSTGLAAGSIAAALMLSACSSNGTSTPSGSPAGPVSQLDFTPFEAALNSSDSTRTAEIDTLTRASDLPALREAMRSGVLTSRELTLFYLERIRESDALLHSVIELAPDALEEADRLDALVTTGQDSGRLHGLPVLLKDNIAAGSSMHNTAGALALADHRPSREAFIVARLRAEGALILGKTNLSEWANFMSSKAPSGYSAVGGQVFNPFGNSLEVFGSSTGSAVAASARFAAATIGTETTGSIIAPAAANGVAGMRPTLGLVSADLIIPISAAIDSAGPISRRVADLAALLDGLATRDDSDPNAPLAGTAHNTDFSAVLGTVSLGGLRIGIPTIAGFGADEGEQQVFEAAIEVLETAGATVVPVEIDPASLTTLSQGQLPLLTSSMAFDVASYFRESGASLTSLAEVITFNQADLQTRAPFGQDYLITARDSTSTPEEVASLALQLRTTALAAIANGAEAANVDVLLSINNTFSLYYALAGTPAVTVPMGRDTAGQPHGATFVGITPATDATVLAVAHAFETAAMALETPGITP